LAFLATDCLGQPKKKTHQVSPSQIWTTPC